MPATSHDVARMAGVSQSTVSRALRGEPGMSEATRARVRQAATALAYVPFETGRALSTRATRRVGVVADELTNPFYPELVEPIRVALEHAGYRAVLIPDSGDAHADIARLADGSVDGVVLTTVTLGSGLPHALAARSIPFVLVNRVVDSTEVDVCVADNHAGSADAARLIAQLDHRDVAAVLGPATTSTSRDRELGFREGLSERGVPLPGSMVKSGPFSFDTGYRATRELLRASVVPTAIFCANDVIALGACNAAAAEGLQPGRDLTVVGFDDIPMAEWEVFGLTTVRSSLVAMAQHAIELLMRRISEPDRGTERIVVPSELVLRRTHGPPR